MRLVTYNPKQVLISLQGRPVTELGDDTFCKITMESDLIKPIYGIDGKVAFSQTEIKTAVAEITMLQNSFFDRVLRSASHSSQASLGSEDTIFNISLTITDLSGGMSWSSSGVSYLTIPEKSYAATQTNNTWRLLMVDVSFKTIPKESSANLLETTLKNIKGFTNNIPKAVDKVRSFFG